MRLKQAIIDKNEEIELHEQVCQDHISQLAQVIKQGEAEKISLRKELEHITNSSLAHWRPLEGNTSESFATISESQPAFPGEKLPRREGQAGKIKKNLRGSSAKPIQTEDLQDLREVRAVIHQEILDSNTKISSFFTSTDMLAPKFSYSPEGSVFERRVLAEHDHPPYKIDANVILQSSEREEPAMNSKKIAQVSKRTESGSSKGEKNVVQSQKARNKQAEAPPAVSSRRNSKGRVIPQSQTKEKAKENRPLKEGGVTSRKLKAVN